DLVFRSTGRAGVVLLSEGPKARSAKLLAKEKKRHERILPNVPVHTLQGGKEEGQLTMKQVVPTVQKLPRKLNRAEVLTVRNRLAALGTQSTRPPIPKGIAPNNARQYHKAMRGRRSTACAATSGRRKGVDSIRVGPLFAGSGPLTTGCWHGRWRLGTAVGRWTRSVAAGHGRWHQK